MTTHTRTTPRRVGGSKKVGRPWLREESEGDRGPVQGRPMSLKGIKGGENEE